MALVDLKSKLNQLVDIVGFKDVYLKNDKLPNVGDRLIIPNLSNTFSCRVRNSCPAFP